MDMLADTDVRESPRKVRTWRSELGAMSVWAYVTIHVVPALLAVAMTIGGQGSWRALVWAAAMLLAVSLGMSQKYGAGLTSRGVSRRWLVLALVAFSSATRGAAVHISDDPSPSVVVLVLVTVTLAAMSSPLFAIFERRLAIVSLGTIAATAALCGLLGGQLLLAASVAGIAGLGLVLSVAVSSLAEIAWLEHRRRLDDAGRDGLTGLLARAAFLEAAPELASAEKSAIFILDLDNFKSINDTFGHDIGDGVMLHVSSCLTKLSNGLVGRLGGDEFVVLVQGSHNPEHLMEQAEALISAIAKPVQVLDVSIEANISIGIGLVTGGGGSLAAAMQRADLALFAAKAEGGGSALFYDEDRLGQIGRNRERQRRVRTALDEGQVTHFLQPTIDLSTNTIQSVELLARLRRHNGDVIAASEFLDFGLHRAAISRIDKLALDQVVDLAKLEAWDGLRFAINVEPSQLGDTIAYCSAKDVPFDRLVLEITERGLFDSIQSASVAIREAHEMGTQFVLDDFGTGTSSLARLVVLPLSGLKLDKTFCFDVATSPQKAAVVSSVVALAADLGLKLTAEGVETPAARDCLVDLGVQLHQGYLYSAALPASQIQPLLSVERRWDTLRSIQLPTVTPALTQVSAG